MSALPRIVFHVDMDAFFVSVEELFDPSLKGKPVVVGGNRDERGVVSAASYAARAFGVHSAMPLRTAAKLCPQAIFVPGHRERYLECSRQVRAVLNGFSPKIEMASIDEAYLDMTGTERLWGPAMASAHALHEEMKRATGLNCSVGIGSSRLIAKVASGKAKPHGILMVPHGAEASFLAPLDVGEIPGVGKVMQNKLAEAGIFTVADVARLDPQEMERRFGEFGRALAGKSRGEDAGAWFGFGIGEGAGVKSISHEHTYSVDTADAVALETTLMRLSEMVGRRLREQGYQARTLQLKLRYSDFATITRAHTPPDATQLDNEIYGEIRKLFRRDWKKGRCVRLLGVCASNLVSAEDIASAGEPEPLANGIAVAVQMSLLAEPEVTAAKDGAPAAARHERWRNALLAADKMRDKFGDTAIGLAGGMKGVFREKTHDNMAELRTKKFEPLGTPSKSAKND